MLFDQLGLTAPLLKALKTQGYTTPTPIQAEAIPKILDRRDLLGLAQTGTGKTAAFALPILHLLHADERNGKGYRHIRTLILTPTRELALQIHESFEAYGKHTGLRQEVIFGGVPQHAQTIALRNGTDILVATPGRLLDLMNQGYVHLDHLEIFVLDEADRMLDMGFINDVKKIIRELPVEKQTLLFSATMPPQIAQLAAGLLKQPVTVEVTPVSSTVDAISQSVFFVSKGDKQSLLEHIIKEKDIKRTLVFARTKHGADRVAKELKKAEIRADAIHGNKTQSARQNALNNFKTGRLKVLVATDIAARGIDVDDLTHVINFDLPNIPETYVHRIGRTGRAGNDGTALSFCDAEERAFLKDINQLIGLKIPAEAHPFEKPFSEENFAKPAARKGRPKQSFRSRQPVQNAQKKSFQNNGN